MTILNAAAELLVENERNGVRGALKVGDVAKRAGVSRTTLYRHFVDRDGLLGALQESHGLDVASASTRERILSAFARQLLERSLKSITVEEVAAEAGVSTVTVYRHFDDRVGMAQAFFTERGPRHDAAELLLHNCDDNPIETLVRFVTRLVQFMRTHRALVLDLLSPDDETRELMSAMRHGDKRTHLAVTKFMAGQIEQGRIRAENPEDPALALFALVLGFAAIFRLPEGDDPPPREGGSKQRTQLDDGTVAEKIVGAFWNGFGS